MWRTCLCPEVIMKKAISTFMIILTALLISCQAERAHVHEWDAGTELRKATCTEKGLKKYTCRTCGATKTGETEPCHPESEMTTHEMTFLTPKYDVEVCKVCRKELGARTVYDEYKSVEGYWQSKDFRINGPSVTTLYREFFSLDDNGGGFIEEFKSVDDGKTFSGKNRNIRYEWTLDSDKNRTGLKIICCPKEEITFSFAAIEKNGGITLRSNGDNSMLPGDFTEMILTRKAEQKHVHTGNATPVTGNDSETYHLIDTACTETSHPQVSGFLEQHTFDSTEKGKEEYCSKCNSERQYRILFYEEGHTGENPECEKYCTKREGFTLEKTLVLREESGITYTVNVKSWKNGDGESLRTGDKYYPKGDNEIIFYTRAES